MKKNRILALTGAACLSVALLAGCGSNNNTDPSANSADNGDASALSGKVATGGSTSMQKLMSMLQEDFMAKNNGVTVSYDPTGSGAGITGASDGSLDIGLSSRVLHDDETDVEAITVCLDGIAVVVNNANGVEDLSLEQLAGIFSGEITNWSEVGGSDGEIVVIGREAGSGTRDGFEEIVGVKDNCKYFRRHPFHTKLSLFTRPAFPAFLSIHIRHIGLLELLFGNRPFQKITNQKARAVAVRQHN